ncbi:DNA methylase [Vibrio phage 1.101.O._10N.261.45.C6]|nr:DNA methylase [Vibrio phage 1.101.O._10N.261.45.C6]
MYHVIEKDNGTKHWTFCGDFLSQGMPCKVDMVLTDLPYGTTQAKWDTPVDLEDMWEWLSLITSDRTPTLLFAQTPFDKVLGASNIKKLKYEWIWEKTAATGHLNAKKMPMKAHENVLAFLSDEVFHENVLTFYNKLPEYNPQKTEGHKPTNSYTKHGSDGELYGKVKTGISGGGQTDRYPRDVLKFASDKQKLNLHSTQKPLELLRYFIRTYTNVGDTVLDFTSGSMSLAVACYLEGRNSVCIEQDEVQYLKSIAWVKGCSFENYYRVKEN